jgi:hypothetical protein
MNKILSTAMLMVLTMSVSAQLSISTFYNHNQLLASYGDDIATRTRGFSIAALYGIKQKPFSVGIEIGQSTYNSRQYGQSILHNNEILLTDVKENNTYLQYHGILRWHFAPGGVLEPYADGRIGAASFVTSRCLGKAINVETGEETLSKSEVGDYINTFEHRGTNLQAGLGIGTVVNLKRLVCQTVEDYGFEFKLDTGMVYYTGTNAVYNGTSNDINRSKQFSPTSNLTYRVGVVLGF